MGLLRAIVLFLVLAAAALVTVAATESYASAPMPLIHQSFEHHGSAGIEDHCESGTTGTHDTSQDDCCRDMNCAQSGVVALTPLSVPVQPPVVSRDLPAVVRMAGRNIAPDTGPPKPLA